MEEDSNETVLAAANLCRDRLGRLVPVGEYFVPDDPCRSCLCDGGVAVACAVMQCSQPECSHWIRIDGECCMVQCAVKNASAAVNSHDGISKLSGEAGIGLRLLASGTTSLLIILISLYILYHLWQKCKSGISCRVLVDCCHEETSDVDYLHRREDASSDVCRADQIDMSIALPPFEVETPPPPYTPPKTMMCVFPPYEEAPPPYEFQFEPNEVSRSV